MGFCGELGRIKLSVLGNLHASRGAANAQEKVMSVDLLEVAPSHSQNIRTDILLAVWGNPLINFILSLGWMSLAQNFLEKVHSDTLKPSIHTLPLPIP